MLRLCLALALALSLVLTGIGGLVAQTRMLAAGEICGTGGARVLLDAAGLPMLDSAGEPIRAVDCLACHLQTPADVPGLATPAHPMRVTAALAAQGTAQAPLPAAPLPFQARAPPRSAV